MYFAIYLQANRPGETDGQTDRRTRRVLWRLQCWPLNVARAGNI